MQLADQWDGLHRRYSKRLSSRRKSSAKTRSSGANSSHSLGHGGKSGSFTASFHSSGDSTPSLPDTPNRLDDTEEFDEDGTAADSTAMPSYISVERKVSVNPSKAELSESDIIDPDILKPRKKSVPEPPFKPSHLHGDALRSAEDPTPPVSAAVGVPLSSDRHEPQYDNCRPKILGSTPPGSGTKVMDSIMFLSSPPHEYDNCKPRGGDKGKETTPTKTVDISARYETAFPHHMVTVPQDATPPEPTHDHDHEYANLDISVSKNLPAVLQAVLNKDVSPAKSSSNSPKKPMPIQRKRKSAEEVLTDEKELSVSSISSDSSKSSPSQNRVIPKKPLPPAKPLKLQSSDDIIAISSGPVQSSSVAKEGVVTAEVGGVSGSGLVSTQEDAVPVVQVRTRSHSSSLVEPADLSVAAEDELSYSLGATKPRSYTNVDQRPDLKKQDPLLPPAPLSSNLVVFGQLRHVTADPAHSKLADFQEPESKVAPQVTVPTSSHDLQPSHRSKVITVTKPLPPFKTRAFSATQISNLQPAVTVANTPKPAEKSTQVYVTTKSKAAPPPKPPRMGLSRAGSGGGYRNEDDASPKGREELMRKLSLRRMRIEEQIAARTASPTSSDNSNPGSSSVLESVSERSSGLSASGSLTEVVVAYHSKKLDGGGELVGGSHAATVTSPDGAAGGRSGSLGRSHVIDEEALQEGSVAREKEETLAKFGIIEDLSGGTYVI